MNMHFTSYHAITSINAQTCMCTFTDQSLQVYTNFFAQLNLSMQAVMCQWTVVIQLFEFHNPKNIERKMTDDGCIQYCCCDDNENDCESQPIFFFMNNHNCAARCDIFFVVNVYDGSSKLQSISTVDERIQDSPPESLYPYNFSFTLDNSPNLVSFTKFCKIYVL